MIRLAVLASALVAACAAPKSDPRYAQGNGSGSGSNVTCHEVTDTGTMFSHTECTPVEDQQNQQDDAQRWVKKPRAQPTGTKY